MVDLEGYTCFPAIQKTPQGTGGLRMALASTHATSIYEMSAYKHVVVVICEYADERGVLTARHRLHHVAEEIA